MVSNQPWYFGKIDEDETEKRLHGTKSGTYLVKDSSNRGQYVLCVNECGQVGDYPISRKGGRFLIEDRQFADIKAIIDFYTKHLLDTVMLTNVADREGLPSPTSPTSPGGTGSFKY